jgi:hypothetical protein
MYLCKYMYAHIYIPLEGETTVVIPSEDEDFMVHDNFSIYLCIYTFLF